MNKYRYLYLNLDKNGRGSWNAIDLLTEGGLFDTLRTMNVDKIFKTFKTFIKSRKAEHTKVDETGIKKVTKLTKGFWLIASEWKYADEKPLVFNGETLEDVIIDFEGSSHHYSGSCLPEAKEIVAELYDNEKVEITGDKYTVLITEIK